MYLVLIISGCVLFLIIMEYRMSTKYFRCPLCFTSFKKLVNSGDSMTVCPNCSHPEAEEQVASEFNREPLSRNYSMVFDNSDRRSGSQQRPSRAEQQPQASTSRQSRSSERGNSFPFGMRTFIFDFISPFRGQVNNSHVGLSFFDDTFDSFFGMPFNTAFRDNFASNFTSNFAGPQERNSFFITLFTQRQRPNEGTPTSQEALNNLKRFEMTEEHCKKQGDQLEFPTCCVCLCEIEKGNKTVLLPCGHMFHDQCIEKWLSTHNTCPTCRFELKGR